MIRAIVAVLLFLAALVALAILLAPAAAAAAVGPATAVREDPEEALLSDVAEGVVRAVGISGDQWYECGEPTAPEDYVDRAVYMVRCLRSALSEVGLENPYYTWAATALVLHESQGNPCAIGPGSRKWAAAAKLIDPKRNWQLWTREDVTRILTSDKFTKKRRAIGADSGLGQNIWPHNAYLLDADGHTVRVATLDEVLTVEGGARMVAYHLLEKTRLSRRAPWAYWPGHRDVKYYERIMGYVRMMRGPAKAIQAWAEAGR
jgi:hypothetical protein